MLLTFVRDWVLTVLLEGAVLWVALDPVHAPRVRILAAWWLSTCTLPLVQFVFPLLESVGWPRWAWGTAAEVFAPLAECMLFTALVARAAAAPHRASRRDMVAIVLANLVSFGTGVLLHRAGLR